MPANVRIAQPSRRDVLRLGAVGAVGMSLAGCARGTSSQPAPGDVVTLFNDNPTWAPGFLAAGEALKQKVGYTLSPRAVPNVSNYQQIVRMSGQTDSSSDLIKWWNGYRLQDVARASIFTDVTAAWDAAASKGWVDDPPLREAFSYQGRQYALPLYKSYYVMFYSKRAFARLGVGVPSSWDDLLRIVDAARKAGMVPIAASGASSWESLIWFQQVVNSLDPDFYRRLTNGQASYTDPIAHQAMDVWVDLYRRGAFSAPDIDAADVPGAMAKGTTAMGLFATWNTGAFLKAGLSDSDFGAFLTPTPSGRPVVVVESGGLAVSANARKPEAALAVASAWLGPDVQQAWVSFLKDISANQTVVTQVGAVQEIVAAVKKQAPTQAVRFWEASPPVLVEGNVQDLSAFMTDPTAASARSTLSGMQQRAEQEWKAWRS